MCCCVVPVSCFASPLCGFCLPCCFGLGLGWLLLTSPFLVVLMSTFSLSPLSVVSWASSAVVVSYLRWDASTRSILCFLVGQPQAVICRTGRASSADIAGLVALLRESRDKDTPIILGVRSGWSGGRWFCAVRTLVEHAALHRPGVDKPLMLTGEQQYDLCPRKNTCNSETCSC